MEKLTEYCLNCAGCNQLENPDFAGVIQCSNKPGIDIKKIIEQIKIQLGVKV